MQKDYMNYVNIACKEGMKPEEVQDLFNEIYSKSNTRKGKKVLRLFAKGIGKAKKKNLINNYQQQLASQQQTVSPEQNVQQKSYQYVYK